MQCLAMVKSRLVEWRQALWLETGNYLCHPLEYLLFVECANRHNATSFNIRIDFAVPTFTISAHDRMIGNKCMGGHDSIKLYRHPKLQLLSSIVDPAPWHRWYRR